MTDEEEPKVFKWMYYEIVEPGGYVEWEKLIPKQRDYRDPCRHPTIFPIEAARWGCLECGEIVSK